MTTCGLAFDQHMLFGMPQADGKKKKKKETVARVILKKVTGVFQPGKLTYVMGASGAGK